MYKIKKIRTKLVLMILVIVFIFSVAIILFRQSELTRLNKFLNENAREKSVFFEKILELKSSSIRNFAFDYTFYDEMVSFINKPDRKWAKETIDPGLDTFKTSAVWIYRTDQSMVYSVLNSQIKNLNYLPCSELICKRLFKDNKLVHFFVSMQDGILEIVGATVHPSADVERKTAPKGYFFTGRLWSDDYINELSNIMGGKIQILPYKGEITTPKYDYEKKVYSFSKILFDSQKNPIALLQVYIPDEFMNESIRLFNISLFSFICLSLILILLISLSVSRWLISPLGIISKSLETENAALLQPLKEGKAEFSELSVLIERFFSQRIRLVEEILEHEKSEKALIEVQKRFKALFEFSPDAICIVTPEGKIVDCNSAASQISGYSKEELLNMKAQDFLLDESIKHLSDIINKELTDVYFDEHSCKKKDGSFLPVDFRAKSIIIENERFFIVILREISERKKLQKEKEKELFQKRQIESLGILAGGIAHDFNNMLTGILGNISLAKFHSKNDNKVIERLEIAEKVSMKAQELTQQLLTFSKGGVPVKVTASMRDILIESVNFLLSGKNIKCNFSIQDDLWFIEADIGQLNQVISNLIINAIQAMPEGGSIDISAVNEHITSSNAIHLGTGKYVKVSIKDSGMGIAEENLERIFEPYFTTKQEGSGLGLAVIYSIIKRHKGYITVASKLGEGTTFTFYLPATEAIPEHRLTNNKANILPDGGTILIMDDDISVRDVLGGFVEHLGFNYKIAKDGGEAIDLYKKAKDSDKPFDIVIMDLTIPGGMGGKDTIKALLEIDPDVRAILVSGYSSDLAIANYREYGFKAAISKPFRIEALRDAISKVF